VAGEDFAGLVEAGRLAIGLMLYQSNLVGEKFDHFDTTSPVPFISVHLMSAMIFLGSASDRLRDFFVASVFEKEPAQYQSGNSMVKNGIGIQHRSSKPLRSSMIVPLPIRRQSFLALPRRFKISEI
jgi:hypothetical protein